MKILWKKFSEGVVTKLFTIAQNAILKVTGGILVGPLAVGAARTLTREVAGHTFKLDTAAGSTATLPPAIGSGAKFRFVITTIATSNSHKIQVANANDTMIGVLHVTSDNTAQPAAVLGVSADATAGADTITLNRSTTGSIVKGEWIEVEDIAANVWSVCGQIQASGSEATPFSAAV